MAKAKKRVSTQRYLNIAEIRDDVVILKDGSLRGVLLASSINFALKSEDEQNAIIQGYISFLNTIDFPLQIVVQSRQLNIDAYIDSLNKQEREQGNQLLRTQIVEYRNFIQELVTLGDIMGKRFYVVVPYTPGKTPKRGFWSQLASVVSPASVLKLSNKTFEQHLNHLSTRIEKVRAALSGFGINAAQLNTHSLVELYYESYNVELAQAQELPDQENTRTQVGSSIG